MPDATPHGSAFSPREPPCVVHLVWGPLGIDPVRAFLASYRAHPAGAPHRLVMLFNGTPTPAARKELAGELEDITHESITIEQPVLDLDAYRQAAERLAGWRYLFLNSYSRLLAEGWLAHLDGALEDPGVGIAAASGSWASMLSYALFQLGLPSAYRGVFADRRSTLEQFERLHTERTGQKASSNPLRRHAGVLLSLAPMLFGFTRFPSVHVRTNAFSIDHETLMKTFSTAQERKVQTHRLESGRAGITAQIERDGRRAVVVDRTGRSHECGRWPESETFWHGAQSGLLVADNQTDFYAAGDADRRQLLSRYAWGERASPL